MSGQDASPSLSLAEGTPERCEDDLPADARALAYAFRRHALDSPAGVAATVPAGRALRRDYLPSWSRARYAAAMRALLDSGHYSATRQDGRWHIRVTVPRAV
jgi:hypothetical protein